MDSLGKLLLFVWLGFTLLMCLIVGIYYFDSRKKSNNYFDDPKLKLRYFIQPQVNYQGQVIGYECLLRQRQPDGTWRLPRQLKQMPLQRVIQLLKDTFANLPTVDHRLNLAINLDHEQIASPEFTYFVRWAISQIQPMTLIVEYQPDRILHGPARYEFKKALRTARGYGMKLALDDIDAHTSTLKQLHWLLAEVDMFKCDMRNFRKADPSVWLEMNLQSWNHLAQEKGIELMLTGIENAQDDALAAQLNIQYRQGYLFGHPSATAQDGVDKVQPQAPRRLREAG